MRFPKLLMLAAINFSFADGDWYARKMEGWYYFQEDSAPCIAEDAVATLEEEKTKLQETLSLAVLDPTQENVKNYVAESQRQLDRSAQFADAWGKALETPLLEKLSKTHFLLFCFRGKDPLSIEAAKTAKRFAKKHGWTLKAISLDGVEIEGLPSEPDHGISKTLDIESTPSFYVVDPTTNEITPLTSLSDLELQFGAKNE